MKLFTKFAVGAALLAGAATIAAAPASAQPYGYYPPRAVVCDPYSRFYDPFYCTAPYYGPAYGFGGPSLSFSFGSGFRGGFRDRDDFRRGNDGHGGGNNWHGGSGNNWNGGNTHTGGGTSGNTGHGSSGGHRH
jgi:hypothetical protein